MPDATLTFTGNPSGSGPSSSATTHAVIGTGAPCDTDASGHGGHSGGDDGIAAAERCFTQAAITPATPAAIATINARRITVADIVETVVRRARAIG